MRYLLIMIWFVVLACSVSADMLVEMDTPLGSMIVRLFNRDKPVTVSNFLNYVESGRYQNMFFHRAVSNFVVQGGGYVIYGDQIYNVSTDAPIINEYHVGRQFSNTYGTMAMARVGGQTNSATSQFFFNLNDNSFLDGVDGGFTVFGEVVEGTNVLEFFKHISPDHIYPDLGGVFISLPVQHKPPSGRDLYLPDVGLAGVSISLGSNQLPSLRMPSASGMTSCVQRADTPGGPWTTVGYVTNRDGYIHLPVTNIADSACFRFWQEP